MSTRTQASSAQRLAASKVWAARILSHQGSAFLRAQRLAASKVWAAVRKLIDRRTSAVLNALRHLRFGQLG